MRSWCCAVSAHETLRDECASLRSVAWEQQTATTATKKEKEGVGALLLSCWVPSIFRYNQVGSIGNIPPHVSRCCTFFLPLFICFLGLCSVFSSVFFLFSCVSVLLQCSSQAISSFPAPSILHLVPPPSPLILSFYGICWRYFFSPTRAPLLPFHPFLFLLSFIASLIPWFAHVNTFSHTFTQTHTDTHTRTYWPWSGLPVKPSDVWSCFAWFRRRARGDKPLHLTSHISSSQSEENEQERWR